MKSSDAGYSGSVPCFSLAPAVHKGSLGFLLFFLFLLRFLPKSTHYIMARALQTWLHPPRLKDRMGRHALNKHSMPPSSKTPYSPFWVGCFMFCFLFLFLFCWGFFCLFWFGFFCFCKSIKHIFFPLPLENIHQLSVSECKLLESKNQTTGRHFIYTKPLGDHACV